MNRMQDLIVYNEPSPCPYLPGRVARLPLRQPAEMTSAAFDARLAEGDRRLGYFLYRVQCPSCRACESIRIPIEEFHPRRTLARTLRKGDERLVVRVGPPECDDVRIELYNRHKRQRNLDLGEGEIDRLSYYEFLVATCCDTIELTYWHNDRLVAVAVSDLGASSISAVYCYYDPDFRELSLGTYNVLKQVEFCRRTRRKYLYLGYYIAQSPHMQYKARFLPHQRLIGGQWRRFDRDSAHESGP
jgi:leucyl-tRNA---protein transferase